MRFTDITALRLIRANPEGYFRDSMIINTDDSRAHYLLPLHLTVTFVLRGDEILPITGKESPNLTADSLIEIMLSFREEFRRRVQLLSLPRNVVEQLLARPLTREEIEGAEIVAAIKNNPSLIKYHGELCTIETVLPNGKTVIGKVYLKNQQ